MNRGRQKILRRVCVGSIALWLGAFAGVPSADAATLIWDPGTVGGNGGGTGNWTLLDTTWFDPSAVPPNQFVVWNNTGETVASFRAPSTVTVANGSNTIFTGGLEFTAAGASTVQGGKLTLHTINGADPAIFANPGVSVTISTILDGVDSSTSLVVQGGGTVTLSGANTYQGVTYVENGELILNSSSGPAIAGDLRVGDASGTPDTRVTLGRAFQIANTASVTVNSDGIFDQAGHTQELANLTINGTINNTNGIHDINGGFLIVDQDLTLRGGVLKSSVANAVLTLNGNLTVGAFQDQSSVIGSDILLQFAATTVINVARTTALGAAPDLRILANTGGSTEALVKEGAGVLRLSNVLANLHTGGTFVNDGVLELDGTPVDGSVPGKLVIGDGIGAQNSAVVKVLLSEEIANDAPVVLNSDGRFEIHGHTELIGSIAGSGNINLESGGTLQTTSNDSTTFSGAFTGSSATFRKGGTGTLTLTGGSTFGGDFVIAGGTVRTENTFGLFFATVKVATGDLSIGGSLTVDNLDWGSGKIGLAPGTGGKLTVTNALTNAGSGGTYLFSIQGLQPGTYTVTSFGTTDFTAGQFLAQFDTDANIQSHFSIVGTDVLLTIDAGATATGRVIQNRAPVNTPTFADFTVSGPVETGGVEDNNTVNSLIFTPGSSLLIHNNLTASTAAPTNLGPDSTLTFDSTRPSSLTASELDVQFGALLKGNGTIIGNVVNRGTVSPGNSPGTIAVTGNYQQTSTGTLRIEIGGRNPGEYDRLLVGGHADLDGRLELIRLNRFELRRGDKITFLTAVQGVDGEFSSISSSFESGTILEPTVVYGNNDVSLELVRGSFEDYASRKHLTPNQRSVARALDTVSADEVNQRALVFLDQRALKDLPGDFDRIAPEELSSIFSISTALAQVQGTNLQRRTDDLRHGSSGFSASGLAMQGNAPGYSGGLDIRTGMAGPTGQESKVIKEVVPEEQKHWGAFLTGVGEWVDVKGDGNARGYDITTGGFTLGLDYKVTDHFAIGINAGYAGTKSDLANDGSVWVNGGKLGLYSTYFTGGLYFDTAVTGGYNSYDTKRSALQGAARGSTEGGELNVLVGTGYDWHIGGLQIGPTATFNYTLTGIDDFTEHGSLAPLHIGSRNAESIRSAFGFKASYDIHAGASVVIRPEIRAAWQHEYGDRSYDLSGSFAGGAGDAFLVNGPEIGRDSLLIGAGFAIQLSETCSTYFYYDGELGAERYTRHSVSGGFRVAF